MFTIHARSRDGIASDEDRGSRDRGPTSSIRYCRMCLVCDTMRPLSVKTPNESHRHWQTLPRGDMHNNHSQPDLKSVHQAALRWLVSSHVRGADGAYRSIYKPRTREYEDFYPGDSCLGVTAGAVVTLERAGYPDLALQSAGHIRGLLIEKNRDWAGALPTGRNSQHFLPNFMMFGVLALLHAHRKNRDDGFLQAAARAGTFVMDKMQLTDGSFYQMLGRKRHYRLLTRHLLPRHTMHAACIPAFLELCTATGEARFRSAALRFADWLCRQQRPDGSFPLERHTPLSKVAVGLRNRDLSEIVRGGLRAHPAAHTYSIQGLMLLGRIEEARRAAQWLSQQLGPNGLLYQFYYPDGTHSIEEDVMPTAHLGLLVLEYPELGLDKALPATIAEGVAYAQIRSEDPDAHGALRGLPLHPIRGDQAYAWDTIFGIELLHRILPT